MNSYAHNAYKANNVQSMSPGEQIARLLETAAKHINRAREQAQNNAYEARFNATEDAMKIIIGLQSCLYDTGQTRDMVNTLNSYYNHLTLQITHINIYNDADKCTEVCKSLMDMANTWRQIEQRTRASMHNTPTPISATTVGQVDMGAC